MEKIIDWTCNLESGLHARPAAMIEEFFATVPGNCYIKNLRNAITADCSSLISMISADILNGDKCEFYYDSKVESALFAGLKKFILQTIPAAESAKDNSYIKQKQQENCKSIRDIFPEYIAEIADVVASGSAVAPGFAEAKLVFFELEIDNAYFVNDGKDQESAKVSSAIKRAEAFLSHSDPDFGLTENAVRIAHLGILRDSGFLKRINLELEKGKSAGHSIVFAGFEAEQVLMNSANELIRNRAADVREVVNIVLQEVYGQKVLRKNFAACRHGIVAVDSLSVSDLVQLKNVGIRGLIFTSAAGLSHAALVAKNYGIPVVDKVARADVKFMKGKDIYLDGYSATVALCGKVKVVDNFYKRLKKYNSVLEERKNAASKRKVFTVDGDQIDICINLSGEEGAEVFSKTDSDGVGLFRTEFLYMKENISQKDPSQRLYEYSKELFRNFRGKKIIIRTVDAGGDKPIEGLTYANEENPFLGCRGMRLYYDHPEFFKAQVSAILKAAEEEHFDGYLGILIPMITTEDDAVFVSKVLRDLFSLFTMKVYAGAMLETPAACDSIDMLAEYFDFFSVGTNDLLQYYFAASRSDVNVSGYYKLENPVFVKRVIDIVETAKKAGKSVGICGDAASVPEFLPVWQSCGVDYLSVPPAVVSQIRYEANDSGMIKQCDSVKSGLRGVGSLRDLKNLFLIQTPGSVSGIFTRELIVDTILTKSGDVIREAVDLLFQNGRIERPFEVEKKLLEREAEYSTSMGFGFAVPHCKSENVLKASAVVLRPRRRLLWATQDSQPIDFVILLAIPDTEFVDSNLHMKIFSKLARKIMHESFRKKLKDCQSNESIFEVLGVQLVEDLV